MNIIVNGAAGRMGQQVCRLVEAEGHTLAAAVDRSGGEGFVSSLAEYTGPADVVIDFSNHAGVGELVDYCVSRGLPLVAATTGYTPEEFAKLEAGAKKIAIFQSYNMSVGVALLADAVKSQRPDAEYVYGRSGQHKRQPNEIGIHSLRMGNVVGEHEVIFATDNQTITLKHQAHDRALFAEGALTAAGFLVGQPAGFYHMDDLLGP